MDIIAIVSLIERGVKIAETFWEKGNSEGGKRATKIVTDLIGLTKAEEVTADTIKEHRALLDALLDEFNEPLPTE